MTERKEFVESFRVESVFELMKTTKRRGLVDEATSKGFEGRESRAGFPFLEFRPNFEENAGIEEGVEVISGAGFKEVKEVEEKIVEKTNNKVEFLSSGLVFAVKEGRRGGRLNVMKEGKVAVRKDEVFGGKVTDNENKKRKIGGGIGVGRFEGEPDSRPVTFQAKGVAKFAGDGVDGHTFLVGEGKNFLKVVGDRHFFQSSFSVRELK